MTMIPGNAEALLAQIAQQVAKERTKKRLTQDALAARAGISRQTVIALESGQMISGQSLLSIMSVLGLGVAAPPPAAAPTARPTIKALMREQRARQSGAGF